MNREILSFIIAFALPHIYYRIFLLTHVKEQSIFRKKTGLRMHHAHYGMIILLIAVVFLLFMEENIYITTALGFGMGFLYDEFIPALMMKSKRTEEMAAYKKSFKSTLIMFIIIILLLIILSLLYG